MKLHVAILGLVLPVSSLCDRRRQYSAHRVCYNFVSTLHVSHGYSTLIFFRQCGNCLQQSIYKRYNISPVALKWWWNSHSTCLHSNLNRILSCRERQSRSEDVDFPFSSTSRRNYIARYIRVRGTKIDGAAFKIGDRGSVCEHGDRRRYIPA